MKNFLILAALLSLAACNKSGVGDASAGTAGGECLLTARCDAPDTKVAGQSPANEKTIRNVQIFVFRAGDGADRGVLEMAASAGFDRPLDVTAGSYGGLTLKCSAGYREVWAVVNDAVDRTAGTDAVRDKADFLARTHDLASSSASCLLMVGHANPEASDPALLLVEGTMQVTVPVHRLAASVVLESVKNDFSAAAYQGPDLFRLEAAYLLNVPGRVDFGERRLAAGLPAEQWHARMAAESQGPCAAILYDDLAGELLPYGGLHAPSHTFYAYPNECPPSVEAAFCPRATLLVLEASIRQGEGWTRYYYPVVLDGGLQANKRYRVNLTVHRPGSQDPNVPVAFNDMTPVIQVSDWDDGATYSPEI